MNAIERNSDRLVADFKRVVQDSEELLRQTANAVGEGAEKAHDQLRETVEAARHSCRQLERQTGRAAKAADKTVREHPYESMGVSLALGVLIGLLLHRRP